MGVAYAAPPPLPTPCTATSCGSNAQQFVQYGKAGASVAGNTMNVTQSTSQAILNWANFNIANGYTVNFQQPSATASVLNKIWSSDPSKIAGSLQANGQVYLYNQNGIIFAQGAQVNTGSLIASTLPLATVNGDVDYLYKNGILSNNNAAPGTGTVPAVFQAAAGQSPGEVSVEAGATLAAADGGRIMLLGSGVTNRGTISTPDGQTLIGAGKTVYLAASSDPALRGLLIEVAAGGTAENDGQISAPRGNITVAGLVVNQAGTLSATTSVGANGSIYLVAGDTSGSPGSFYTSSAAGFGGLLPNEGGTVTLAPGSTTEITADTNTTATLSEQNLSNFIPSQVNLVGQSVTLQGNAKILAPGAAVAVNAEANPAKVAADNAGKLAGGGQYANDGGRIYLDNQSVIDVSGLTNVAVPVTNNILTVKLEGNDLADDPLLRASFLHGLQVTVDANRSPLLFDLTPYKGNIPLGISQILTNAGSIQLNSNGDVITRAGSTLNVSGGTIAYQGGYAASTTQLMGANGKIYDISNAPKNLQYLGVANSYSYTDPTWGTTTSSTAQSYYSGYLQGGNAGQISVLAPQIYLRGTMQAQTTDGIYQRTVSTLPTGGLLQIGCQCVAGGSGADYRAPAIEFMDGLTDTLGTAFAYSDSSTTLPAGLQNTTLLSPTTLSQSGFSEFNLFSNGSVILPLGTNLTLAAGGSLAAKTIQSININGNITIPSGTVSLNATGPGGDSASAPVNVALASGASIDVAGNWTNDSPTITNVVGTAPIALNGGNVSLTAAGDVILGFNSSIDVSGGGWMNSAKQLSTGTAGKIVLSATYQASKTSPDSGAVRIDSGAQLSGASLSAGSGGSLNITSGSVTVGSTSSGDQGELLLAPEFFSNQGFQNYALTGLNDVTIGSAKATDASPVFINPIQETLAFTKSALLQPTGAALGDFTKLQALPAVQRKPANISFSSTTPVLTNGATPAAAGGPESGSLILYANSSIITDPGATVSLVSTSDTGDLTILGTIVAPAGKINLSLGSSSFAAKPGGLGNIPFQELLLGSSAVLNAAAYASIDTLDAAGYREGSILQGGAVSLQANKGFIVTATGSVIDVSGTAGVIDVIGNRGAAPKVIAGSAGAITIDAREGISLQGSLLGHAATYQGQTVAGAGAGSLTVGLDLYDYATTATYDSGGATPLSLNARTLTLSNQPATALASALQNGLAQISTQTLQAGGFDNITLKSADVIAVSGDVSLTSRASLTVDSPLLRANAGSTLQLTSASVALGNFYNQADYFSLPPSNGGPVTVNPNVAHVLAPTCATVNCTGTLTVNAGLIDIRGVSGWDGFTRASLNSTGDIRLSAAQNPFIPAPQLNVAPGDLSTDVLRAGLNVPGDLILSARQVYPTTNTDFTISARNSVTIQSPDAGNLPATPLSAAGIVTINAPQITQNGVLRAPLGEINLLASDTTDSNGNTVPGSVTLGAGSTTSVAADGLVIPYGSTLNGSQWTYAPDSLITQIVQTPLAKSVNLSGSSVSVAKGASVDVSGGGDLQSFEWIAGPQGSKDVLAAGTGAYQYAILPSLGSAAAPLDAQYLQGSWPTSQTVYLSGIPGLAAGTYALLPARYALLPGAYAVSVVKQNSNVSAGAAVAQPDGSYVAVGQLGVAGTDILSNQTSTFLVASSAVVNTQAQYNISDANTFFSAAAKTAGTAVPSLPADAGALQLFAERSLALNGTFKSAVGSYVSGTDAKGNPITVQGVGGQVSIEAPSLVVVDSSTAGATTGGAGALQLDAQALNALGAQTLVLGATVQYTSAGETISLPSTGATSSVEIDNPTTALSAPQIILAAQNSVVVDSAARISAAGTLTRSADKVVLTNGGALLIASSGSAAPLQVVSSPQPQAPGSLSVGSGATVQASGNVLLYSSGNTAAASDSAISAPALGLYSSRVSIGDVPVGAAAPSSGLNLTEQLLTALANTNQLTIGSASTIDLYGAVNIGASSSSASTNITLDAWAINGYGAGDKFLQAGSINFVNNNLGAAPANLAAGTGSGSLTLRAVASSATNSGGIVLGAGAKTVSGFSAVNIAADGNLELQGTGSLNVVAQGASRTPLTLQGAAIRAGGASEQAITVAGAVNIGSSNAGAASTAAPLGGKLTITGDSIANNGTIDLPSGILSLHATTGDVSLGATSVTNAAGSSQNFVVTSAAAPGGQVFLTSDQGNVSIAAGATVDVSGASSSDGKISGAAGSLNVSAPRGQFLYSGAVLKGAAAAGQQQGAFTLDIGSGLGGSGLDTLAATLASSGFTGAVDLRTRTDSQVSLTGTVVASSFQLAADQGSIDLAGTINTSGGSHGRFTGGGSIAVWAENDLSLEGGAKLLADAGASGPAAVNGTALTAHGGDITLGTEAGTLVLNGGRISSLGSSGTAADGTVTFRAPRTSDQLGVNVRASGVVEVDTHNPIVVEGFQRYTQTTGTGPLVLGDPTATTGALDITQNGGTNTPYGDAVTFVGNGNGQLLAGNLAKSFKNKFGAAAPVQVQVRPGIEIYNNGDIVVGDPANSTAGSSAWDLDAWNAALGVPVNLALRAGGNLIFNESLSDGFTNSASNVSGWQFGGSGAAVDLAMNNITVGVTAGYRLAAGADLAAANPLAVKAESVIGTSNSTDYEVAPSTGNFILTPGNLIRTGDGSIHIAAGGDVLLGYSLYQGPTASYDVNGNLKVVATNPLSSVIYTAGVATPAPDVSQFVAPNIAQAPAAYPTDGGNIDVTASADIRSAPSAQLTTDWLWRRGQVTLAAADPNKNTTWWVNFNNFKQGIGALGGGDVSLSAGNDIVNVSAVIPTTGRLLAAAGSAPQLNNLLLDGGGYLSVRAGNDIGSGIFEDDWGNATIVSGRALRSTTTLGTELTGHRVQSNVDPTLPIYPIILLGAGTFDIESRTDTEINFVGNSTTLPQTSVNTTKARPISFFYTYSADAAVNIMSTAGNVVLDDSVSNLPVGVLNSSSNGNVYVSATYNVVYPGTLGVAALSGDISLLENQPAAQSIVGIANYTGVNLYPSAIGNLSLLADGFITGAKTHLLNTQFAITMSETDPAVWASVSDPLVTNAIPDITPQTLPAMPLHDNDAQAIDIVARTGGISAGVVTVPKQGDVIAGGDIFNLTYTGKNLHASDVTLIEAGGQITYSTPTTGLNNALTANQAGVSLAGPGYLEVLSAGNLNLGDSNGIVTSGSLSDVRLPTTGATILVGAGFGDNSDGSLRQPAYQAFTNAYLAPDSTGKASSYATDLLAYMKQLGSNASSYPAALTAFESLTPAQQLPLLSTVLLDELSATGIAHNHGSPSYDRGYNAINTLFPTQDANKQALSYSGDIDMFFSQIKTEQGGNINLLAPGGSVVVGVPNPPVQQLNQIKGTAQISAVANLGLLVLGQGAIEGFANQSFEVNQSRILTLEGGDIILWASNGDIDAGRGAKSASAAPPPIIQTDTNGNVFVNPINDISGSGIGQLLSGPGETAGLVNLIAPKGTVNAGDAGIRVAGDLNLAAAQVIGANNITVSGTATGVPTSDAGALSGALSGANSLGDASKAAVSALAQDLTAGSNFQALTDSLQPTFVVVKLFCLGLDCKTQ